MRTGIDSHFVEAQVRAGMFGGSFEEITERIEGNFKIIISADNLDLYTRNVWLSGACLILALLATHFKLFVVALSQLGLAKSIIDENDADASLKKMQIRRHEVERRTRQLQEHF